MTLGDAFIVHGDSRRLLMLDNSVDLVVTSPPYFALRSYQDGGEHYGGQLGSEPTPAEFVDSLIEVTRECVRVLKPSGSLWVNLGDKYVADNRGSGIDAKRGEAKHAPRGPLGYITGGMRQKSLMGIPWRYALRCIDDLGLILRAEVIWSKPNGLPESVTDRVRRSHEQWFHFTLQPRYFSAVDEIREAHLHGGNGTPWLERKAAQEVRGLQHSGAMGSDNRMAGNPLGKLPGSVWTIPTEPLRVPDHLGIDHFAAFPTEFPRRIIRGWSPAGVCVECGEGRRPIASKTASHREGGYRADNNPLMRRPDEKRETIAASTLGMVSEFAITGYACACPEPTADTTPGVVLDPFGGTGTTALVAKSLGRIGISADMSADYCRLAQWRTTDPYEMERCIAKNEGRKPVPRKKFLESQE